MSPTAISAFTQPLPLSICPFSRQHSASPAPSPHHRIRFHAPRASACLPSRRSVLRALPLLPLSLLSVRPSFAESLLPPVTTRRPSFAAATLLRDVIYPAHFRGTWDASSACVSVEAPAGEALFGPSNSLASARATMDDAPLTYPVRFVGSPAGVVADRAFNVAKIAVAAMGNGAVLDCAADGPNRVSVSLRPKGAGGEIFSVDMDAFRREFEAGGRPTALNDDQSIFFAKEMVRQRVQLGGAGEEAAAGRRPRVQIKDVLTECVYVWNKKDEGMGGGDVSRMLGRQRTSVFYVKGDPRDKEAAGRAVDVREYDVEYVRKR